MTEQTSAGPGTNTGHGHVWPRPDGRRNRCGGPALCGRCREDAAPWPPVDQATVDALRAEIAQLRAGAADDPGPEDTIPTPAQLIARVLKLPAAERITWAESVLEAITQATLCTTHEHDAALQQLTGALRTVQQAAQQLVDAAEGLREAVGDVAAPPVLGALDTAITRAREVLAGSG